MPTPVGHVLGGLAAGLIVERLAMRGAKSRTSDSGRSSVSREDGGRVWLYAALGLLPDLDLLAGMHSGYTHSLGAIGLVGLLTWRVRRHAALAAAAYGSHVLLDWLGSDTSPPVGIMALWPFSSGYHQSSLELFLAVRREYWLAESWTENARAVWREILVLGPVALASWWRRTAHRGGASS